MSESRRCALAGVFILVVYVIAAAVFACKQTGPSLPPVDPYEMRGREIVEKYRDAGQARCLRELAQTIGPLIDPCAAPTRLTESQRAHAAAAIYRGFTAALKK